MRPKILIVDDEKASREGLALALEDVYEVQLASKATEAFQLMEEAVFALILTDLRMAGPSGLAVLDKALALPYKPICIMMTAYGSIELAVEAMKRGAYDFLTKPISIERLRLLLSQALKEKGTLKAILPERKISPRLVDFRSCAPEMLAIVDKVKQVAPSKSTVLLTGETGTGKEVLAHLIHQNSLRSTKPFISVHCAALPANLLESELFGFEKGAFTGATERHEGRFERAHQGTLFLDEIGEIDLFTQVKLLRFLETRSFERIGGTKTIEIDLRLICATHRHLESMVKEGLFREDLFYRLNVLQFQIPPLRERREDIPLLLDHYLKTFAKENHKAPLSFQPEALSMLKSYPWPGNVRELRNFAERMVVLSSKNTIEASDLEEKFWDPLNKQVMESQERPVANLDQKSAALSLLDQERQILFKALQQTQGNRTQAAALLGIHRRTLHRKLLQYPELG